jgi:hypothetical protein
MPIPPAVKFTKSGVTYIGNVDRIKYTLTELTRAALKDCGKYICRRTRQKIKRRTGKLAKNTQYWVRKRETDLQVGFKPGGFYGMYQELGTDKIPKIGALANTTKEEIAEIIKIQGMYLSAIENEQKALSLIDESEALGDDDG